MTTREQIIAAAKEAGLFAYGDPLERFYSIAHEDGRASRDEEIAELRKQLTSRDAEIFELKNGKLVRRIYKDGKLVATEVVHLEEPI